MREIKFRAWHPSGGYDEKNMKMTYWKLGTGLDNSVFFKKAQEVMQFTGLLDKNGKEIYEGDIITFTEVDEDSAFGREETHTGVVKWVDSIAQWRFIYPSGQRRELHLVTNFEPVYKCEIFGNIYENPELLS